MEEDALIYSQIIAGSNKKLAVLKVLSNFFNHPDLVGILIRTEIIHHLFESNQELDIHKLDLFHTQYTSSVIELLRKIKKGKEQQYQLTLDEIRVNEEYLSKLNSATDERQLSERLRVHSRNMSAKIRQLYQLMAFGQAAAFSWEEVTAFSDGIKAEYYREITPEQYNQLNRLNGNSYKNEWAAFEKKLLGRLNIYNFRIRFCCGLESEGKVIEVYEIKDSKEKFLFIAEGKSFFFLPEELATAIDLTKNTSRNRQIVQELETKNSTLKDQLAKIKYTLAPELEKVLEEYLAKISSVRFMDNIQNVDEQTNILKAMLKMDMK